MSQAASNHSKNVSSTWCLPVSQWSWLKHTCERILHNKHLYHDAKHFAFPTERRMQRWQWGQEGHVCQNWREKLSISIGRLFFLHLQPLLRLFFSCTATIILQPWRWKVRGIISIKWVETNTHAQPMSTASYDVCHIEDSIKARAAASCQRWWRINNLTLFLLRELKDNTHQCVCVCVFMRSVTCFVSSQRGNNIGFGAKVNGNLIFDFIFYSNIFPVTLISDSLICGLPLSLFVFSSSSLSSAGWMSPTAIWLVFEGSSPSLPWCRSPLWFLLLWLVSKDQDEITREKVGLL